METDIALFYVVCGSKAEAQKIAHKLLETQLIACANIGAAIQSLYKWKGKVEEATEYPLLLKSTPENFEKIETVLKKVHSYDCPCLIMIPSDRVNSDYQKWLTAQLLG